MFQLVELLFNEFQCRISNVEEFSQPQKCHAQNSKSDSTPKILILKTGSITYANDEAQRLKD